MELAELFGEKGVILQFSPVDKWEGIGSLVQYLTDAFQAPPDWHEMALEAVLRRERSMSTGMERGIAIPHAALDGLPTIRACLAVTPPGSGIAFESMDGAPTELVCLLLIPKDQKLLHIRTLAEVARILGRSEVREQLKQCGNPKEALSVLNGAQ